MWLRTLPLGLDASPITFVQGNDLLRTALELPSLRLPSLGAVLLFLIGYIVLVGPINYLVLRRFDRREWAYLTIPLTVLLFTAGAYLWGTRGRGGQIIATAITVVEAASGSTAGQATTQLGLFSPFRSSYNLAFAPDALVSDDSSDFNRSSSPRLTTRRTSTAVEVPDVLVDVGALEAFTVEQPLVVPALEAAVQGQQIVVANRSTTALEDVVVMINQRARLVGTLAPGEQRTVDPPTDEVWALPLSSSGVINRQQVLIQLSNRSQMIAPGIEVGPDGAPIAPAIQNSAAPVVLLAWLPSPSLALQIDSSPADVTGETVLVVGAGNAPNR